MLLLSQHLQPGQKSKHRASPELDAAESASTAEEEEEAEGELEAGPSSAGGTDGKSDNGALEVAAL